MNDTNIIRVRIQISKKLRKSLKLSDRVFVGDLNIAEMTFVGLNTRFQESYQYLSNILSSGYYLIGGNKRLLAVNSIREYYILYPQYIKGTATGIIMRMACILKIPQTFSTSLMLKNLNKLKCSKCYFSTNIKESDISIDIETPVCRSLTQGKRNNIKDICTKLINDTKNEGYYYEALQYMIKSLEVIECNFKTDMEILDIVEYICKLQKFMIMLNKETVCNNEIRLDFTDQGVMIPFYVYTTMNNTINRLKCEATSNTTNIKQIRIKKRTNFIGSNVIELLYSNIHFIDMVQRNDIKDEYYMIHNISSIVNLIDTVYGNLKKKPTIKNRYDYDEDNETCVINEQRTLKKHMSYLDKAIEIVVQCNMQHLIKIELIGLGIKMRNKSTHFNETETKIIERKKKFNKYYVEIVQNMYRVILAGILYTIGIDYETRNRHIKQIKHDKPESLAFKSKQSINTLGEIR